MSDYKDGKYRIQQAYRQFLACKSPETAANCQLLYEEIRAGLGSIMDKIALASWYKQNKLEELTPYL